MSTTNTTNTTTKRFGEPKHPATCAPSVCTQPPRARCEHEPIAIPVPLPRRAG